MTVHNAVLSRQNIANTPGHLGRRHINRMWQALRIHRDMALDTRYLLACVIVHMPDGKIPSGSY